MATVPHRSGNRGNPSPVPWNNKIDNMYFRSIQLLIKTCLHLISDALDKRMDNPWTKLIKALNITPYKLSSDHKLELISFVTTKKWVPVVPKACRSVNNLSEWQ